MAKAEYHVFCIQILCNTVFSVNPRRVVIGVEQGLLAIWCILLQHYLLHISIELKVLHLS